MTYLLPRRLETTNKSHSQLTVYVTLTYSHPEKNPKIPDTDTPNNHVAATTQLCDATSDAV